MNKRILILFLTLALSNICFSEGRVGNGAGEIEQIIASAHEEFKDILKINLQDLKENFRISSEDHYKKFRQGDIDVLEKILNSMDDELKLKKVEDLKKALGGKLPNDLIPLVRKGRRLVSPIQFVRESEFPDLFTTSKTDEFGNSEAHRIARTDNEVNSFIFFNLDRLYPKDSI